MRRHPTPQGVILLFLVLILGSTSLAAAAMLTRGSLSGLIDANQHVTALGVREKVMGCLDEAFIQLQKNTSWAPASVSMGPATCTVAVTSSGTGQKTITLSLTDSGITRKVKAIYNESPFSVTQVIEEP